MHDIVCNVCVSFNSHITPNHQTVYGGNDGNHDDDDDDVTSSYYRQNSTSPGRVLYTVSYHELL